MTARKETVGEMIDRLAAKRAEIREAGAELKRLKEDEERIEAEVLERFDELGTGTGSSKVHAATANEDVVPQVVDWDAFYEYLHHNKYYHLLQRRPSTPGCRELFEKGDAIPGVEKFTRRKINLRSL